MNTDELNDSDLRLISWALFVVLVLGLSFTGCAHYMYNLLPQRMAEKGFCWTVIPVGSGTQGSYQPCLDVKKVER